MDQANAIATVLCGVAVFIGVLGTIVPVLPGSLLIPVAVAVWALVIQSTAAWVTLGIVVALVVIGNVVNYLVAGKRMVNAGVPRSSLIAGGVLGIVGFFVIPLFGLPLGFLLGLYLAEYRRLHRRTDGPTPWASTLTAAKAVGIGLAIEALAAQLAAATWVGAVVFFDAAA